MERVFENERNDPICRKGWITIFVNNSLMNWYYFVSSSKTSIIYVCILWIEKKINNSKIHHFSHFFTIQELINRTKIFPENYVQLFIIKYITNNVFNSGDKYKKRDRNPSKNVCMSLSDSDFLQDSTGRFTPIYYSLMMHTHVHLAIYQWLTRQTSNQRA